MLENAEHSGRSGYSGNSLILRKVQVSVCGTDRQLVVDAVFLTLKSGELLSISPPNQIDNLPRPAKHYKSKILINNNQKRQASKQARIIIKSLAIMKDTDYSIS